jgi:hypothetical protein
MNALRAAFRYMDVGKYGLALRRVGFSMLQYPLPLSHFEVSAYLARPRFAVAALRRLVASKLGIGGELDQPTPVAAEVH